MMEATIKRLLASQLVFYSLSPLVSPHQSSSLHGATLSFSETANVSAVHNLHLLATVSELEGNDSCEALISRHSLY